MAILECQGVSRAFGGVQAISDITIRLPDSGVVALIGPNGAGKTTLLNMITGFLRPDEGRVLLDSHDITHLTPYQITRLGLVRTFQNLRLVPSMTVLENVMLAFQHQRGERLCYALAGLLWQVQEHANRQDTVEILRRVGLSEDGQLVQPAGELSYGQQKILSLACCLAAQPNILFLDEPVAGVHPVLRGQILALIRDLANEGRLVAFIEHDIEAVRQIAERVIVMDEGRVIADGCPSDVLSRRAILEAYLD